MYDTANVTTDVEVQRIPSHIDGVFQVRGSHLSGSHTRSRRIMEGSRPGSQHASRHSAGHVVRSRDSQMRPSRERRSSTHAERRYLYDELDDDRHRSLRRRDDVPDIDRRPLTRQHAYGSNSRSRSVQRMQSSQRRRSPVTSVHSDETSPRAHNFNSNRSVARDQPRSRPRVSPERHRSRHRRSTPEDVWRVVEPRTPRRAHSQRRSSRRRMSLDTDPEDVWRVVTPSPRSGYSPGRSPRRC